LESTPAAIFDASASYTSAKMESASLWAAGSPEGALNGIAIALLESRQRLVLPLPVNDWFALAISRPELKLVGLSRPATIVDSVNLPGEIHPDPADRFLIATARARRAVLVTHDEQIITYGQAGHVKVLPV
jgi:hypothetical protein